MLLRKILLLALLACFFACAIPSSASENARESAGGYTQSGLAAVEHWEEMLAEGLPVQSIDTKCICESLLEQLTWLYEVDKVTAALPHIKKLVAEYNPATRYGFSRDGKIEMYIAPMELFSPDLAEYSFFLVNIENRSAFPLECKPFSMSFTLTDGTVMKPEDITPGHALYKRLERMANTFAPQDVIRPGATISFKAVLNRPQLSQLDMSFVQARLDGRLAIIRFYGNL